MMQKRIWMISLGVRLLQAIGTRTFFQPDEYLQALEPAHRAVFGYGHLTWEWTVDQPIRSILFPSLWMPVYYLLKITKLDQTEALILAPKLLQGLFAAITDVAACKLARRVEGPSSESLMLVVSLCSFFHGLALVRTLSNSLETSLTTLALCYWPLEPTPNFSIQRISRPLVIAALACIIRPTNGVLWVFLIFQYLFRSNFNSTLLLKLSIVISAVGSAAILLLYGVDSFYFGKSTLTPLNFLKTNLSHVSLFYGGNPWHYYLSQAIPILLTSTLPLFIHGVYLAVLFDLTGRYRSLFGVVAWTIGIYSLAGHKEWRFIHPLLPIMHLFCVKSLSQLAAAKTPSLRSTLKSRYSALLFLPLPAILYVTFAHGRAQISVLSYLRSIPSEIQSIGFLMPCHSTPWMAYLHKPELSQGRAWSLGCEPPLGIKDRSTYVDQTGAFYESPLEYISQRFPAKVDPSFPLSPHPSSTPGIPASSYALKAPIYKGVTFMDDWKHAWPEYLVMFGVLPQTRNSTMSLKDVLTHHGYKRVWRTWNGFEEDQKRRGGVEVWRFT